MNIPNGTILKGTYRIVRFIAAGGFGCTYEAEHIMLGKRVAIKEFFVADFCNRDAITSQVSVGVASKKGLVTKLKQKFLDEAKAIAQMSHPNIVCVSDVFEDKGTAYYVMDYIDGKSLANIVLERGRLTEQEAVGIIRTVASALKYVHSRNRLHLDIKPGNIMVKRDGRVFLIDFGVSKQYDEIDGQNTSTLMGYSSGYAPVEQMSNRVKNFTPATDIYALGATFYTLLTGIMPPVDSTDRADEDTLKPLPSNISASVRTAIVKAMNVSRSGRIQSIDEFISILNKGAGTVSSTPAVPKATSIRTQQKAVTNEEDYKITMVDLGLPSGLKWANMNVGAKRPEEIGDYYTWGDTDTNFNGNWNGGFTTILKMMGVIDSNKILKTKHDVAIKKWGGKWHMPTLADAQELINNTNTLWTTRNGVYGRLFTSKVNGNSIFMPASGYLFNNKLNSKGETGYYWCSTFDSGNNSGTMLDFSSGRISCGHAYTGAYAYPVRPVSK